MDSSRSTKRVRRYRLRKSFQAQLDNFDLIEEVDTPRFDEREIVPSHTVTFQENLQSHLNQNQESHFCDFNNICSDHGESDVSLEDSDNNNDYLSDWEQNHSDNGEDYMHNEGDGVHDLENDLNNYLQNCDHSVDEEPEISELRVWAVITRIPRKHLDSLLKILQKRLLPSIPISSYTLLHTSSAQYTVDVMIDTDQLEAEFSYLGIKQGLKACVNPLLHSNKILTLDFNIDGVKIKKSSPKTMWPILCKVYYEPMPNIYKPFTVSVFYGNSKPKDNNKFFEPFVRELNDILVNGVSIKCEEFRVVIRSFICDTPARAQVKATKGPVSFNGCERCDVVAYKVDGVTVYASLGNKRTDEDFRLFVDTDHHTGASPLLAITPKINHINQFILDSMHLLYLGCMLRLFENWMTGDLNVRISANQKSELNRQTKMLKADIPKEFARKMRPSSDYDKFKAVEHRFFVLYCGPIVLKKILPTNLYNHFLLFHVACRLLTSKKAVSYVHLARDYMRQFVKDAISLYGAKFMALNIHNLCHVADDVENMQCNLNDISAFPYESELGKIKNILLSPHRTIAQYCRRIHEERSILNQVVELPPELVIFKNRGKIKKCMYKQQWFSTKHPDNSVKLRSGHLAQIVKIFACENKIYLKVVKYKIKKSLYTYPCDSAMLDIYEIENVNNSKSTSITVSLESLSCKLIKISVNFSARDETRSFIVPLLH